MKKGVRRTKWQAGELRSICRVGQETGGRADPPFSTSWILAGIRSMVGLRRHSSLTHPANRLDDLRSSLTRPIRLAHSSRCKDPCHPILPHIRLLARICGTLTTDNLSRGQPSRVCADSSVCSSRIAPSLRRPGWCAPRISAAKCLVHLSFGVTPKARPPSFPCPATDA